MGDTKRRYIEYLEEKHSPDEPEKNPERKYTEQLDKKDLELIVGSTVTEISQFEQYGFDCFILHFSNGMRLIAQDGEYGSNTFRFMKENE